MGNSLRFDYYYGAEAEQFSFYRVPSLSKTSVSKGCPVMQNYCMDLCLTEWRYQ